MAMKKCLLVSLSGLAVALAQPGQVAGPVAGYVFDNAAHALRPVLGIPGASMLGDALNLGIDPVSATVSPKLDSVIAVGSDRSFHLFSLRAGTVAEVPVNGLAASPERVVFSPGGTAAALYAGGRIQVLTGLPSAPAPGGNFDLSPLLALPGGRGHAAFAGAFAVSDDGACLLVAGTGSVQLFGSGGSRQLLSGRSTAIAFAPGTHTAALAGTGVTVVKDVDGAAAQQTVSAGDATQSSVGAAFSTDASKLYVASAQGVTAFDLNSGTRSAVSCSCTPTSLTGMGSVYRLNEVSAAPLWLLDPSAPRIVFVPAKASL